MTYHLEPWIEKIASPILLVFPDKTTKAYMSGREAMTDSFSERFIIDTVHAEGNVIKLTLQKAALPDTTFF